MSEKINCDEICKCIPSKKYQLLHWSTRENAFVKRSILQRKLLSQIPVPFLHAWDVKLKLSSFGQFLKKFNFIEFQNSFINQNKLCIVDQVVKCLEMEENATTKLEYDINNNMIDDYFETLKKVVNTIDFIDHQYFLDNLEELRLTDFNVNLLDTSISGFHKLETLVLAGNWLDDIDGNILPRRLKYLELYGNKLTSVVGLTHNSPKSLIYLSLSHNPLTNDSDLHLLAQPNIFPNLKGLDLSDCDIYGLLEVLEDLKPLQQLKGLLLTGNPCSVIMAYKELVIINFPELEILDRKPIMFSDRELKPNVYSYIDTAQLVIKCSKIYNLTKPKPVPANKIQTIHAEFEIPILQNYTDIAEIDNKTVEKERSEYLKVKPGKPIPTWKKPADDPEKRVYAFKTEYRPYAAKMALGPVVLESPERNLYAVRDCLRSEVLVQIVYLERKAPDPKAADQQEVVLKRVPIASFVCQLRNILWNEESVEYMWSEHPQVGPRGLEPLDYKEAIEPKPLPGGGKPPKPKGKAPAYFTCHRSPRVKDNSQLLS